MVHPQHSISTKTICKKLNLPRTCNNIDIKWNLSHGTYPLDNHDLYTIYDQGMRGTHFSTDIKGTNE